MESKNQINVSTGEVLVRVAQNIGLSLMRGATSKKMKLFGLGVSFALSIIATVTFIDSIKLF